MTETSLEKIFERTQKRLGKLRQKMTEEMSNAFSEMMAEVFKAHPEVKTIYWQQYIPYFNDGDECTFSMNEIHFSPAEAKLIDGPHFGDACEDETLGDFQVSTYYKDERVNEEFRAAMTSVTKFLNGIEDHLQATYGSNAFIKITADGVFYEEMEPPY